MNLQRIDEVREKIKNDFEKLKAEHPEKVKRPIDLSFSTWVFGMETLEESVARLSKYKVPYIELGGNYGGKDIGDQGDIGKVKEILDKYGVKVSSICGFYSDENALSTPSNFARQVAKDYIRNEVKFCKTVGGQYLLVVPGTVGRSHPYDQSDYERSVETLHSVADVFIEEGVKCAVEPINSAEVPICSTVASVQKYIKDVNHSGVQYINGDTFHMLCGEPNVPLAILQASSQLLNLHLADTNRAPVGRGMIDVDTVIRALYLIGFNTPGHFATGEPIGEGRGAYSIIYGRYSESFKEKLVSDTVDYFRERESETIGFN